MKNQDDTNAVRKIIMAVWADTDFQPLWMEAGESMDSLNHSILWSFAKLECSILNENSIEKALYELQEELS
jgi:hypothetical protein